MVSYMQKDVVSAVPGPYPPFLPHMALPPELSRDLLPLGAAVSPGQLPYTRPPLVSQIKDLSCLVLSLAPRL